MSRLLTLQDGKGGFELVGNAFPIDPVPQNIAFPTCICWMLYSACLVWIWIVCFVSQLERRQAYLKKALTSNRISFILLQGTFFKREMTHVKQSARIYNMCCEFMVLRSCAMLCLSWRWVEDKQSSDWKLVLLWGDQEGRRTSHCTVEDRHI